MAETAVSSHLSVISERLADEALKKYARSQGIYSDLNQLGITLSQIQAVLIDASRKELWDESVRRWLNDLRNVAYDIDNVLDDVATDAMHSELTQESGEITSKVRKFIPACCTKFSPRHRLCPKLECITAELNNLYKAKFDLGLIRRDEMPKGRGRRDQSSLIDFSRIIGRQPEKEALLHQLLGDASSKENFSVVPIVGMGGVGKTTMARLLYNEKQVKDRFEIMAWVYVSYEFDLFAIHKVFFQSVSMDNKDFGDLNQLQMALIEQLKGKRFLLVLDDVWTESYEDWENLVRPFHFAAPGSKIIITTRTVQLLNKIGYDHLNPLSVLSHDDAMSLIAKHAFGEYNFDSRPTLLPYGEGIVKMCGGLPLALISIGRLLRTKIKEEDWHDVLNSDIWRLENDSGIIPALRLSYQELPALLKQLFAYCSLFPKDFLFVKEELVLLWMGEGFLNESNATKSQERLGLECFDDLLSRSFFQHASDDNLLFVMHDLMNDLATVVSGDKFLRLDKHKEMRKEAVAKYIHMSFIREEYVTYEKFKTVKSAINLRTCLAVSFGGTQSWDTFYLSSKILVDILPELTMLRVLCLSRFEITEVPDFIGRLKYLRYLNLSQTKIKELPENVGDLYNLQTLIIFGCTCLTKLPESFLKLKMLRHFDIRDTPLLKKLPLGIGELKSLETLTKIIVGGDNGFAIDKLKKLQNLHGKISIEGLQNVQTPIHAREANLSLKRLAKLELKWDDSSEQGTLENEVLSELRPNSDWLEELVIVSYGGIMFPNWVGDPFFFHLVHVSIRGCKKCTSLPPFGQLFSLKELFVQGMDEVKVISSNLTGSVGFPRLEILSFEDMSGWETWFPNYNEFPCLRELHIKDCPKLIDITVEALPLLRVLQVDRCGDSVLRHLVPAASSIDKLEIISISGLTYEVWRDVTFHLRVVEEVRIYRCDEIKYVWESEADASNVHVNLQKLYVYNCSSLVSLGQKEGEEDNIGSSHLSSLRILDVWHCNSMERCCCPNNIESLSIGSCSSLTHVSFLTGGGQKLKSLDISLCNKQMEMLNIRNMPMLEYMFIYQWTKLKSIIPLSDFVHLTHLELYDCSSVESFPELDLSKLTSLQFLLIKKCPSMDYSFPSGLWPPKLVTLGIGGLKKPISEWGHQNLPTSLVVLSLCGEDVSDFSELSHLIPSSLTRLCIEEFDNLKSLSMGLEHLTSLQHLFIDKCPKLIHLPETLLPSLLSLRIDECPNLQERCNDRGFGYWPLIYHIPCIEIEHSD